MTSSLVMSVTHYLQVAGSTMHLTQVIVSMKLHVGKEVTVLVLFDKVSECLIAVYTKLSLRSCHSSSLSP